MKMVGETTVVERSGAFTETSFQINAESQIHIIKIIRDKLYSNKPLAVIREYCTNAYDAHVEAGKGDQPIVVWLPNEFDMHFKVRDFGSGLTEDEVREIYVQYGVSTKRHSNDFVGQLGIGCKSAFAYTDMFMVVSYKDGVKTTYSAFLDETEVGKIAQMSQEPTEESNGVEIIVPVRRGDTQNFIEQARKCFQFFPVKPVIVGMDNFDYPVQKEVISGKDVDGTCWRVFEDGSATAIMGNIGYPLNAGNMGQIEEWERELLRCPIHIRFEIGDVEIAASREALEYKERTIQAIRRKLALIRDTVNGTIQQRVNTANNLLEAKQVYAQYYCGSGKFNSFIQKIKPKVTKWRTVVLDNIIISTVVPYGSHEHYRTRIVECAEHKIGRRYHARTAFTQREVTEAHAWGDVLVVEVDTTDRWFLRAHRLWSDMYAQTGKHYTIFAIKFADDALERVNLYAKFSLSHVPMIKISTIAPSKARVTKDRVEPPKEQQAKHSHKVFVLNHGRIDSKTYHRGDVRSGYWDESDADLKNGHGVYIELDSFFLKLFGRQERIEFLSAPDYDSSHGSGAHAGVFTHLDTLDIDVTLTPIYGIKTAMVPKLGKHWVRFEDWVTKQMVDKLQAIDHVCQRQVDLDYVSENSLWRECLNKLIAHCDGVSMLHSPFIAYLEQVDRMGGSTAQQICHEWRRPIQWLKSHTKALHQFEPSYDLLGALDRLETRYPMLKATGMMRDQSGSLELERYVRGEDPDADAKLFIEYINQTDEFLELKGGKPK